MKRLLYIGNKLSGHGNTVTAIETLGNLLESNGYNLRYASSKKNKVLRFADMVWKTLRYSSQTDYVIIDTYSTQNFWYTIAVSQLCRLLDLKYITILHGGNLPQRLSNNPLLCSLVFGNAYKNVAPSGYLLEAFRNKGFNTIYISNPLDDAADFPYQQRNEIKPKLLWVRAFAPMYNPEMALKTFAILKKQFPDATLCMVGPDKGLMDKTKQSAAAQNLDVTFTGRLTKPEWAALSKNYDIFINTTQTDNAPFSIIEAAALGLVIVSTNVGGIPHLLENRKSAMLVNHDDAEAMAGAVSEVISNALLRQELLRNSYDLVARSDSNSVLEKWSEILI